MLQTTIELQLNLASTFKLSPIKILHFGVDIYAVLNDILQVHVCELHVTYISICAFFILRYRKNPLTRTVQTQMIQMTCCLEMEIHLFLTWMGVTRLYRVSTKQIAYLVVHCEPNTISYNGNVTKIL